MKPETGYTFIIGSFIRNAKIETVLELGVFNGFSTEAILEALPEDGHLWSVDSAPCLGAQERLKEFTELYSGRDLWSFHSGVDDRILEWDREVDMVFIDTSHEFEQTLFELKKFSPFARRFIFLHDTSSHPGVRVAIVTYLTDNKGWAWAEWYHHLGLALLMRV